MKTIADWINANMPNYVATIEPGYCNTDRKPKGVRWRIPGKGRRGNKIVIRHKFVGTVVFTHNGAETYRCNAEVENWVMEHAHDR